MKLTHFFKKQTTNQKIVDIEENNNESNTSK